MAVALDAPAGYTLERLATAIHDRGPFSCGVEALDTFLRTQASQDQDRHTTACHVVLETDALPPRPIVGYVSLAYAVIPLTDLPAALKKKVGRHDNLPALLLGRMAVDSRHKGKRLGEFLLKYALKTACDISESPAALLSWWTRRMRGPRGSIGNTDLNRCQITPCDSLLQSQL